MRECAMPYRRQSLLLGVLFSVVHAVAIALKTSGPLANPDPSVSIKYRTMLIVPEMKFAFCFIPKNACTEFNKLMNALNDLENVYGENCGPEDPNGRSSAIRGKFNYSTDEIMSVVADPTWTKAVFLRDPLERLVSGFRSKCEENGDDCGAEDVCAKVGNNFTRLVQYLPENTNMHFVPQSNFCGGLGETVGSFDYVGYLSKDFAKVHAQVKDMMKLVLSRMPGHPQLDSQDGHSLSSYSREKVVNGFIDRFFNSTDSSRQAKEMWSRSSPDGSAPRPDGDLADALFPEDDEGATEKHSTKTVNGGEDYYTVDTAALALDYYAADYKLPGLMVPEWAHL